MDRSFAARLTRPFGDPRPARGRKASKRSERRSLIETALPLMGTLYRPVGASFAYIWQRRRARIALLVVLCSAPIFAAGWMWLRQSSFVGVRQVKIAGLHGPQAQSIEDALVAAAHRMSTLDVSDAQLRAAVAGYPIVAAIRTKPRFPHGLSIEVIEQPPVAALTVGSSRTAVAADGVVLGPTLAVSGLPTIHGYRELAVGSHVRDLGLRGMLSVLGAAPSLLRSAVARVYNSAEGLTVAMHNGLLAYFGDASRPHAKWLSLVSVLADSGSQGASYVDVRIPSRPAAGFPAGVTPPAQQTAEGASTTATGNARTGTPQSTVASIAAVLAASNNGVASPSSTPTGATSTEPTEPAAAPTQAPQETSAEPSSAASTPGG